MPTNDPRVIEICDADRECLMAIMHKCTYDVSTYVADRQSTGSAMALRPSGGRVCQCHPSGYFKIAPMLLLLLTEAEEHDVALLHDIFLALRAHLMMKAEVRVEVK